MLEKKIHLRLLTTARLTDSISWQKLYSSIFILNLTTRDMQQGFPLSQTEIIVKTKKCALEEMKFNFLKWQLVTPSRELRKSVGERAQKVKIHKGREIDDSLIVFIIFGATVIQNISNKNLSKHCLKQFKVCTAFSHTLLLFLFTTSPFYI